MSEEAFRREQGRFDIRRMRRPPPPDFDCGADEQNRFLHERAWSDQREGITVTHLLNLEGTTAAYAALMTDRIRLGVKERPHGVTYQFVPAMKIAQIGVARHFTGQGLGMLMVGYAINAARWVRRRIGCRYVTLDAQPHLMGWYEAQGFVRNEAEQAYRRQLAAERGRGEDGLPVSMRFDLYDARVE